MARSSPIETARLHIVPFSEEYLTERYVGWLADPEVVRYSEQRYRTHTLESCREYYQSFEGTPNYVWAIVAKDESLGHIGNINAYVDDRHGVADCGIMIGERAAWGKGYASEAWVGVANCLFREVGVRKVGAGTLSINKGMLKVMWGTGMVEDGVRLRHYVVDGEEADLVHGAFFREDWDRLYDAYCRKKDR